MLNRLCLGPRVNRGQSRYPEFVVAAGRRRPYADKLRDYSESAW